MSTFPTDSQTIDLRDLDQRALEAARRLIASRWPDPPGLRGPGGPFGAWVPAPAGSSDFERLLGLLGRPPVWTPSC